jgi:hypothetical protein
LLVCKAVFLPLETKETITHKRNYKTNFGSKKVGAAAAGKKGNKAAKIMVLENVDASN